jgi:hypothetical protein
MYKFEDFQDVKVGDKVIYHSGYRSLPTVREVTRVTKAQFMCRVNENYELKFWKKSGEVVGKGDSYSSSWAKKGTPEAIESAEQGQRMVGKKRKVRELMDKFNLNRMSEEQLDGLIEVLEEKSND